MKMNLTFVFLALLAMGCSKGVQLKDGFPKLKIHEKLQNQKIVVDKEFQELNISGKKIRFDGELKEHQMIAEVMTEVEPERAVNLFKNKSMMIRGLYSIQATPYSGTITKEAGCINDLQINPQEVDVKNQITQQFDLKATERLVLGVCIEEQNVYRNQTLLIYCKNSKTFYDLKYYYPKNEKPLLAPVASCRD